MKQLIDEQEIFSITISVELIMYGYVGFSICQNDNGVNASWIAIADGGAVIADEAIEIGCLNFTELVKKLLKINLPECEDLTSSRSWSVVYCDKDNNKVKGTESGHWDLNVLVQIVDQIDDLSGDTGITEWLHEIIEA